MPPLSRGPARRFRQTAVYGGTPLALPQATTLPASTITATSAFLNGSVNPEGLATSYWFAWGTTPQYGSVTATVSAGSGTLPETVGVALTSLTTGVTYHYALVAQSAGGTVFGTDVSFVAQAPVVVPVAATPLTPFGAPVDQPHFAYPFTLRNAGAVVVEQDSLEEVFACVRAIAACPVGACPEIPSLGIPDPTFGDAPVDPTPLIAAIQSQEPRATEEALVQSVGDPSGGAWQVQLTTRAGS